MIQLLEYYLFDGILNSPIYCHIDIDDFGSESIGIPFWRVQFDRCHRPLIELFDIEIEIVPL